MINASPENKPVKTTGIKTAEPVTDANVKNMYRLTKDLYRSGQPGSKGFKSLEEKGIKSVLNLREYHTDDSEAKGTAIQLFRFRLAGGEITRDQLLDCMALVETAPKPLLIHCWHGSDRTGILCAACRIVRENWTVEDAVKEFTEGPYGFHKNYYGNLPVLLRSIDWKEFKKDLNKKVKLLKQ